MPVPNSVRAVRAERCRNADTRTLGKLPSQPCTKSKTCSVQTFLLDMLDVSRRITRNARQIPKIQNQKTKRKTKTTQSTTQTHANEKFQTNCTPQRPPSPALPPQPSLQIPTTTITQYLLPRALLAASPQPATTSLTCQRCIHL